MIEIESRSSSSLSVLSSQDGVSYETRPNNSEARSDRSSPRTLPPPGEWTAVLETPQKTGAQGAAAAAHGSVRATQTAASSTVEELSAVRLTFKVFLDFIRSYSHLAPRDAW